MADDNRMLNGDLSISNMNTEPNDSFSKGIIWEALPCEAVIIDLVGRIVEVNSKYCVRHDRSRQWLIGSDINEIEKNGASLVTMLGNTTETRLMFREEDGLVLQSNIMEQGRTVGAMQLCFRNVDMGNVGDELSYSHISEDINKLFETNWDVIYASDSNGITLEVSSASKTIWGVEAECLIGKSVYELEKKRIYYPSITRMVLESKRRVQAIQTTATGKRLMVLGTPIKDENGNIIRVINTSRLIINENELFKELEETNLLVEGYKREIAYMRNQEQRDAPFIANSVQMRSVADLAMKVSGTDIAVIITGESGVGKEVLANYIHSMSSRKDGPYIKINCGAIPPTLMESEIFGYERGAFTGAERSGKPGIFELANQGTLFLDEIGEIPIMLQSKLLRVLQENELMRVGGTKSISVDVRIIAATNKNLLEEIAKGRFRKDLYYRLNVVDIKIPPLRERKDDILPLSLFFLDKYNHKYHMNRVFSPEIMDVFMAYKWDGNIRELQNTIERMVVLSPQNVIGTESLPEAITSSRRTAAISVDEIIPLREAHQMVEDMLLQMARERYGTTVQMAEALGVDQSTISRKLKKRD